MMLNLQDEIEQQRIEEKKRKQRERVREWRAKNPEENKKRQKVYQEKHRLAHLKEYSAKSLSYYYRNREKVLQRMKAKRDKEKMEKNQDVSIP